jgi:hypothetical protein
MQKLWTGFLLFLLLFIGASISTADESPSNLSFGDGLVQKQGNESTEASLRIIPDEGQVGEGFTILVSDLNAGEEITVRIIFVETDAEVYESNRTADNRGRVELDIFTESDDPAGEYRVEVLNASNDVIAEASLTLEVIGGREGLISVSPSEGEAGTVFVIEITEVQPFADLSIIVTNEADEEVYETAIRATVDGTATVNFESSDTSVGNLTIDVFQNETISVASGSLVVQEQAFPSTIVLEPNPAMPNDEVFVTVSGLEANATATVVISNVLGTLLSQEVTANVSGLAIFSFVVTPEMALGDYTVEVLQGETLVSRTSFVLDVPAPSVTVSPTVGVQSSNFVVDVAGLNVDEQVVVELVQGETVLQSFTITGDAEGLARAVLGQRLNLGIGDYTVRVLRAGQEVYTQSVSIVEEREAVTSSINPDNVIVTVSPEEGVVPTTYEIRVEGLPPDTDLTLNILFDGDVVYTFQGTSDETGVFVSSVNSEASDPIGTYTLEVRAEGQVIGSADFAIVEDDGAEPTEEPTSEPSEEPAGDVSLDVNPETVVLGERFEINVSNLAAGETVTIDLRVDGESIYSTERQADASGAIGLGLVTEATDPTGEYEVVVLRGDEEVASGNFDVVESNANVSSAELSIEPESAPLESSHTISVSGLEAGEAVTVVIEFDGEEVYSTEREADSEGVVTLVINTESDDEEGEYTVRVLRENGELTGSFTATEAEETSTPDAELEISIDPESGDIGTDHVITVTGLEAEEAVSVQVEYDGEVVYETEGTANDDGEYRLDLSTEEGDPAGDYTITVTGENSGEVSASFEAVGEEEVEEPSEDFSVAVSSEELSNGDTFDVTVEGLNAGETVTIRIIFDGEEVYSTEREADENGEIVLPLVISEEDPEGNYSIEVETESGATSSAGFLVLNDFGDGDEGEGEEGEETELEVTVDPESGENGTTHDFVITGLEPEETVSVSVEFDGEEVYSTEAVADDDGEAIISLTSEESDPAGDYLLIVERDNGDSASVEFTVEEAEEGEEGGGTVIEPTGDETAIELGDDVIEGSLSTDSPEARFVFEGEEGQGVEISLHSDDFDAYLVLLDEDGDEIASNDDGSDNSLDSQIIVTLPESGSYTIVVSSFSYTVGGDAEEGDFELRAHTLEISDSDVELDSGNQVVTDSLSSNSPEVEYVFEGEEGQSVLISVSSSEFDTYLVLLDENGDVIASNDDSNDSLNSQIGPFVLPYSGEYTAIVTSYYYVNYGEVTTGEFNFRLENVVVTSSSYGEITNITIDENTGSQFIEFEGNAGDVISVSVNSNDSIDTTIALIDPTGFTLISDDDGGLGFDPEIERQVLPSNGRYVIMLSAFSLGDAGEVEVLVSLEDARTLDSETRTVRLNNKESYDILVFEGQEGETVSITISLESGSIGSFTLYAEQDGIPLLNYQSLGLSQTITVGFRVPADGIVRITLQDSSASSAILNVELERE